MPTRLLSYLPLAPALYLAGANKVDCRALAQLATEIIR